MGRPPYLGTELPFPRSGTPVRLLERESSLKSLKGWRREAAAGDGRLMLVAGEAGLGKSALLRTFAQAVEGLACVAVGACDPLSTPRPLGPLLDVSALAKDTRRQLDTGAPRAEVFQSFLRDMVPCPPSSSSRTASGRTRRRSTCCGSSGGGSARRALS